MALTSASISKGDGIAVVELFTSEGCSSCPSADAVLGGIAHAHDPRVFPLAFHVDYWNSIGWPDRFSSSDATDRQRQYAGAFGTGSIYTPQMIVQGVDQFTGSDASHAAASIARAREVKSATSLALTPEATGSGDLMVRFHAESAPAGAVVNIAVTEAGLSTNVLAGENRGRTLPHENVVRAFIAKKIVDPEGVVTLTIPSDVNRNHTELIGYVQATGGSGLRGLPVLAAARAPVPPVR